MNNEKYLFFHKSSTTEELVRHTQKQLDLKFDCTQSVKMEEVTLLKNRLAKVVETEDFLRLKHKVANDVAEELGWSKFETLIQVRPTMRFFLPQSHSTSLHCDFWYGHARTAYTIWMPLTKLVPGNSFWICDESKNKLRLGELESRQLTALDLLYKFEDGTEVHPPDFGAAVFSSRALHASPKNTSEITRISFDFRIYHRNDNSCTKEAELFYKSDEFETLHKDHQNVDQNRQHRYLKFIIGGNGASTKSQHIIIDAFARENNINIVAQEAEIERFNFPMLRMYLNSELGKEQFHGIILATETIISPELKKVFRDSNLAVICVLEGKKYGK